MVDGLAGQVNGQATMPPNLAAALALRGAGLSVIPIKTDGSKRPDLREWSIYQNEIASEELLHQWFGNGRKGIGIVCGAISGNLEMIDFDHEAEIIYPAWCQLIETECPGLLDQLSVIKTPKPGYRVCYRVDGDPVPGNQKLAQGRDANGKVITLIETRGKGGQGLAPGTPAHCHETGRPYLHHSGPTLTDIRTIAREQRDILIRRAMVFHRIVEESKPRRKQSTTTAGDRPGDDYNRRGPDWADILTGWECVGSLGDKRLWRRPGKTNEGCSATTGHCTNSDGLDLLAVFSTNADPFPGPIDGNLCSCHTKFDAYARINHGGDHKAAARELARLGYGMHRDGHQTSERVCAAGVTIPPDAVDENVQAAPSDPKHVALLTDTGNAIRLIDRHGSKIRYVRKWKDYLHYCGTHWKTKGELYVMALAREMIAHKFRETSQQIQDIAKRLEEGVSDEEREQLVSKHDGLVRLQKWLISSESATRIRGMMDLARSDLRTLIEHDVLNRNVWLFNAANCTIDLRTGESREHRQEDLLTTICPHAYDPQAQAPRWNEFVREIMDDDAAMVTYLQQLAGMCMSGDVSEQILPVFWGQGSNGKSIFIATLMYVLGPDYAFQAPKDLLLTNKRDSHPTLLASLYGKRLVSCVELPEDCAFDEPTVKALTGNDEVTARWCHKDYFQYTPTATCIVATNSKPRVDAGSYAMWRRLRLLAFKVLFEGARKDPKLLDKLKAEAAGILRWCVEGCLSWQRDGLKTPQSVHDATDEYRGEQDLTAQFIAERCLTGPDYRVKSGELFTAYQQWHEAGGFQKRPPSVTAFGRELNRLGYDKKEANGTIWRMRIALRSDVPS